MPSPIPPKLRAHLRRGPGRSTLEEGPSASGLGTVLHAWLGRLRLIGAHAGIGSVLEAVLRRGLRPLVSWHSVCFFERDLTRSGPEIRARIPIDVRRVELPADIRRLENYFAQLGRAPEEVAARLAGGEQCFIALHEGRLVHFAWLSRGPVTCPEVQATLRLEADELYQGDSFTDEAVRGHRVTGAVMTALTRWERAEGYRRHYFYIERDNHASLRSVDNGPEPRPVLRRTVRSFRLAGTGGVLVAGLDGTARPALHLAEGVRARRLGRLGYWVRRRPAR